MKKMVVVAVLALGLVLMSIPAMATRLTSVFDSSWTVLAAEDWVGDNGYVGPGWGGQAFDAEYLFYKYDKTSRELSIGLQTGFDVQHNPSDTGYTNPGYYAGDLALSFDDCGDNGWEYGVDFGITGQKDYDGDGIAGMDAGLYTDIVWNNDVYFSDAAPFAIESANKPPETVLITNYAGKIDDSYYRSISFIVPENINIQNIAASWTMSCGNDVVRGCAPVPEPQTLLLMGIGLLGLAFVGRKKMGDRA